MSAATAPWTTLSVERPEPGVALVTLRRPERLNAMTDAMFAEMVAVAQQLRDDQTVRAVLLTGEGRAFCAGYDLDDAGDLPGLGPHGMYRQQERAAAAILALRELPQPLIALVNGPATGGGLSLALAADLRIASPAARFNAAFVRIGLTGADLGTSWQLPRIVGPGLAAELLYTGRFVEADEAAEVRLVNRVVPAEELLDAGRAIAQRIAANSPFGVLLTKRALLANQDTPALRSAMEVENRGQPLASQNPDMAEALLAFRERREPRFRDAPA